MIERKLQKNKSEVAKSYSKEEFDKALVKCSACGSEETKYFKQNCENYFIPIYLAKVLANNNLNIVNIMGLLK